MQPDNSAWKRDGPKAVAHVEPRCGTGNFGRARVEGAPCWKKDASVADEAEGAGDAGHDATVPLGIPRN